MRNYRKPPPPADEPPWEAHSTYIADLGVPDRRQYRRTPPGSPTVADLVRPGDTVSTTYSTGGVVIEVKEYFYAAPTGEMLSHYTIIYVPPDRAATYRDTDRHWINECVAVDGRILMLFEANSDEVFVFSRTQSAEALRPRTILITYGRRPTRAFDNCFENYDGDEVATMILRRSRKNARLAANFQRYLSLASIEAAADRLAGVPTRKMPEMARQTRARRHAEANAWFELRHKVNAGTSLEMPAAH